MPEAGSVDHPCGYRDDVLERPANLHSGHVVARVQAERRTTKSILHGHRAEAIAVDDADSVAAMRLLFQRAKALVEPSSAIALAAVLSQRERFAGQRVGIVLTGGNVDLDALPW